MAFRGSVVHIGQFRLASANGVHRTVWGLARTQSELGLDAHVLSIGRPPNTEEVAQAEAYGVRIHPVHPRDRGAFESVLDGLPPANTIVHSHSAFDRPVTRFTELARSRGYPVVRTPNGVLAPGVFARRPARKQFYWQLVERRSFNRAGLIHLVGRHEEPRLRSLGVTTRSIVVPNGVFPEVLNPVAREADKELRLLFIGRLDVEQKGLDLLVEAMARIRHIRVTIVGTDYRGSRKWLLREIQRLGVSSVVTLLEPVFDAEGKRALLATHDAFVHLSRWEGIPFACLEAAAAGLPLIVTPETNLDIAVSTHRAGWVVERATIDAVVTVLQGLDNRSGIPESGLAAMEMVRGEFLWHGIAERLLDEYHRVEP